MAGRRKLKLAVWKFASCDGCQLSLLDCEDELLRLADALDLAYFPEATRVVTPGPYDVSLVEGSITTLDDISRIAQVRKSSRCLVALGACATAGGIQALRNFGDVRELVSTVYPRPDYVDTLDRSLPVSHYVPVDVELPGCPISKTQLLDLLGALLHGRQPSFPEHSVCIECKRRRSVCVMVAQGVPCLGPVTRAGCRAICPSFGRGCYGCYGPMETPNVASLSAQWAALGASPDEFRRALRTFTAWAEAFRVATERPGPEEAGP